MQERKIEDNKIWEAYHRIMAGESLTVVANSEDISLDRGTLKRYIKTVVMPSLNPDEQEKFKNKMSINKRIMAFPKNKHTINRNEVDAILNDIVYQIENDSCPTFGDNVVAIIKSYCNYESLPSVRLSKDKFYHKDAIRMAIPTITDIKSSNK